ncbi:MAG TPA: hypothetical protein VGR55_16345 [Candidatus Acidoferrum sp.]|nr:hypothetical protein [Candidatus Acidoferrum sp.]
MKKMNSDEVKKKVGEFVAKAYASALSRVTSEHDEKLANLREQLGLRGLSHSSVMDRGSAQLRAEMVTKLLRARAEAAAEAYEMYGTLDKEAAETIVREISEIHAQLVTAIKGSAAHQAQAISSNTGSDFYAGQLGARNFASEVERLSTPALNEIACDLERRQHLAKPNPEPSKTTIVYHVYGHNPRWNFNSKDNSVNTVTLTNEQLFSQLKQRIVAEVPQGEELTALLGRIDALEHAQNTPSFGQRYTEFIAAAANHMTLIAPFIPALTELLQKIIA